jgi:AcrR family transcriptional regulator
MKNSFVKEFMAERGRPTGRRPGDSGTREAIQAAARRQFAELGFDRTSMRSVAIEAGVDPGLVKHYFASKSQLFVAVVELPVDPSLILPVLLEGDRAAIGERLARFLVGVFETEAGRRRITGIVRSAVSEPEAARMVKEMITTRLFTPIAEHLDADQPELRAAFVGSQTIGLVMARYIVGIEPLASASPDQVIAAIAPVYQRYLDEPL